MEHKVIHYCWFGGKKKSKLIDKCIKTWQKYMPDYKIKEWNESNFDVTLYEYTKRAYEEKKYAFVSDFVRIKVLYEEGGIYLDTDVELIKSLDSLIDSTLVMGTERVGMVNPGLLMIAPQKHYFLERLYKVYSNEVFDYNNGKCLTIVDRTTHLLQELGLEQRNMIQRLEGITIYPITYFSPIDIDTRQLMITKDTYSIHHFAASWVNNKEKFKKLVRKLIGNKLYYWLHKKKTGK